MNSPDADSRAATVPLPPVSGLPAEGTELSLDELVRIVSRRKWVLTGIVAGATLLAGLVMLLMTPLYTAETLVLIDPQDAQAVSVESVVGGLSADQEAVQSEAYVLASRALAARVVARLGLDREPEFNPDLEAPGAPAGGDAASDISGAPRVPGKVVDRFVDRLEVAPREESRVIGVAFSASDPERAAMIANVVVDEYLQSRLEAKFQSSRRANAWLNARVAELLEQVEAAEVQVESLRKQFGLEASDQGTLSSQEMVEINTQLVMARTARAEAEVRLRRVEALLRSPDGAASASEVLDSPLIQRLREQEAEVQRRVAELSSELGERHPQMIKLRAEAQDLQASIRAQVRKIVAGLRNEVSVARAREQSLQQSLSASREQVALDNEDEIRLRAAEREAESSRSLLATLLSRQKATMSQQDIESQAADARVVAAADPPVKPSIPNVPVVLGLTLLASTLLGLLAILVLEMLDSGFRSGEQIEQQTGAAALGFIPMAARSAPDQRLVDFLAARPKSAYSEAIRTLAWSIGVGSPDRPPKTILITSAQPGEGKTSIASSLAWVQSRSDQRVVIIDADMRQPAVHDAFFVLKDPGLTDVLAGRKKVDEVLQHPNEQGPFILAAGTAMPNIPGMLGSRRMDELLTDLCSRFDLVILDSPPVLAAADARILAQKADVTVMVVQWAKTRRESVRLALRLLTSTAGVRLAGVLLSQVDARKHAQYSYGDSGAYAGALEKYYAG